MFLRPSERKLRARAAFLVATNFPSSFSSGFEGEYWMRGGVGDVHNKGVFSDRSAAQSGLRSIYYTTYTDRRLC